MIEIGSFEAKTHFSDLIKRVENGEEFIITKRGKMVAVLTSPASDKKKRALEVFSRLMELRGKSPVGTVKEISEWKNPEQK